MRRRASTPSAAEPVTVRIERVGAEGDGVARLPDATPLFVPFTLPGELVRARAVSRRGGGSAGSIDSVLEPADSRAEPSCPHFGRCGGCVLQHWQEGAYLAWKSGLLREALQRAGYDDPPVAPIVRNAPQQRRRMDLAVQRQGGGVAIGLHARDGPVIGLETCLVLHPALFALIAPLRPQVASLQAVRREASVIANLLDDGIDLLLRSDAELTVQDRMGLIALAGQEKLLRLSWAKGNGEPEPIVVLRPPVITLSGIAVQPPAGAFLQASAASEVAIIEAVLAGLPDRLPGRARLADLYAGCGTLSFPLAQRARVTAFESDAASLGALRRAVNGAGLSGRVEPVQRDLARQPVSPAELTAYAAVVLDPPHAGAPAQTAQLAAAKIERIIYVSCNPAALARDARMLHTAGYRLVHAVPIDQFLWSARLESVCVFTQS